MCSHEAAAGSVPRKGRCDRPHDAVAVSGRGEQSGRSLELPIGAQTMSVFHCRTGNAPRPQISSPVVKERRHKVRNSFKEVTTHRDPVSWGHLPLPLPEIFLSKMAASSWKEVADRVVTTRRPQKGFVSQDPVT